MADDDTVEALISQSKSGDVDAKVDALTKLQALFEDGTELTDVEGVIAVVKLCLRTANQHLTTAALSAIPPLVRLITSSSTTATGSSLSPHASPGAGGPNQSMVFHVRHTLLAFLPSGGVLDRLGDQRERSRDMARAALVVLASAAYTSGPSPANKAREAAKGHEPPMAIFEKHFRELGLGSKGFRVREQSILSLVEIRRIHPLLPIRPYIPQLVESLEDTDGTVRDCARASVITLFTGPQVTDAARADLKSEMTKKGVRKAIVNDVLAKLLSNAVSTPIIETPDQMASDDIGASSSRIISQKPSTIRSLTASTNRTVESVSAASSVTTEEVVVVPVTELTTVYVASARDLEQEFARMAPCFEGKETEHNWLDREKAVVRIRGMLLGGVFQRYPDAFFALLKGGMLEKTLKAFQSLRTTVANHASCLYGELAVAMGHTFDQLVETVLTHLLKRAGFTKKLLAQQSQSTVHQIITHTSAQPRLILPLLWSYLQEKTVPARAYIIGHIRTYLEVHASRPAGKALIESGNGLDLLEKSVQKALADPNAGVRDQARLAYWTFEEIWPAQAGTIMAKLDSTAKKQLEKVNPRPGATPAVAVAATPAAKKSSVAAAIAASRAKAKLIATAPPTLRHAATSGASAAASSSKASASRREGSPTVTRRAASPSRGGSPVSPARSPNGPRNGLASPPVSRSSSPPAQRPVHVRASTTSTATSGKKGTLPMGIPPGRARPYSPSPPVSPTPKSTMTQRTLGSPRSSPTSSIIKPKVTPGPTASPQRPRASRLSFSSLSSSAPDDFISAVRIPLPPDSDDAADDFNESMNLMSFSSAWENIESSGPGPAPGVPDSVIHDAYRAQALQAESAAAQLLELVHEDNGADPVAAPLVPLSTAASHPVFPQPPAQLAPAPIHATPVTPKSRVTSLAAAVNAFENSPSVCESPSLAKALFDRNDKTGEWWRSRKRCLAQNGLPTNSDPAEFLKTATSKLESSTADVDTLRALTWLCSQYQSSSAPPSPTLQPSRSSITGMLTPTTPSPMGAFKRIATGYSDLWDDAKVLDTLFFALLRFLSKDKPSDVLETGLMVLYELILRQSSALTGREGMILAFLLEVRYAGKLNIFEATNAIRDVLIEKSDPIMGLEAVHKNLQEFTKRTAPDPSSEATRTTSYCFSLVALAKSILLLPAEVLEDELPKLRGALIAALSAQTAPVVRRAAYLAIIAAQMKLRDETHLFAILSGLAETQKHLLTYEFEKIKIRGPADGSSSDPPLQSLASEMRRLDALPPPGHT